jgi:SOS-response transcriptional repressor LexA
MKRSSPTSEVQYVAYLGEVGCGKSVPASDNVYPFIPKDELIPVPLPAGMSPRDAGVMTVRGMSLTDFNVWDGDRMVVKTRFSQWRDIDEDTICVVYIHATGELVAKRIIREANTITLKASGGGIKDIECAIDEVEIRAIVLDFLIDAKTQMYRAKGGAWGF